MTQKFERVSSGPDADAVETRVQSLLAEMTLSEKIGQMQQHDASGPNIVEALGGAIKAGQIGSVLNQTDPDIVNELQRLAVEDSRLGIPLLIGRDVIHGFETVAPIPIGLAASWNPELVRACARDAAREARRCGINWTFAPMIDISRDGRWGRIAESFGEDPYLTSVLGVSMIEGFQGDDLAAPDSIAACAKHFAGYGASESGRDYNTTNIPENELRNIYLPPFKASVDAGVATFMASFGDIDGVPATANEFLLQQVLREEWDFDGLVVSDWNAVCQLSVHGLTEGGRDAALQAVSAGIDMEMAGDAYSGNLADLVESGEVSLERIDRAVANILRIKFRLNLFEAPYVDPSAFPPPGTPDALQRAKQAALESVVLLKNYDASLPLQKDRIRSIAVIGPMADVPDEQLGTWVFDGKPALSITPLQAIRDYLGGDVEVHFAQGLKTTRSRDTGSFSEALEAANASDAVLLFLGEEAILSGEAHCRADINLPGVQDALVRIMKETGKPVIVVIQAGRPLTLENILPHADAILFAWHPGVMGGPALCDLLFGVAAPSGKLPVSFPKMVGQIPIYYNQKNTGRPPSDDTVIHIDDIEIGAGQTSLGMTAFHLDAGYKPRFPFGFGLSYTDFDYRDLSLSADVMEPDRPLTVSVMVRNTGSYRGTETVQLYVRDLVGSVTRPVRELRGFRKIDLEPGESRTVTFVLSADDLAFYRRDKSFGPEAGDFHLWVGGSSDATLRAAFTLVLP